MEAGKPDSWFGQALGIADTGVVAKADKAISQLSKDLARGLEDIKSQRAKSKTVIKSLQFDIFGCSRGAAAARRFANRIQVEDATIIRAIWQGMAGVIFNGAPSGKSRFIGLFDRVAAISTPMNGLNPHSADTGNIQLILGQRGRKSFSH